MRICPKMYETIKLDPWRLDTFFKWPSWTIILCFYWLLSFKLPFLFFFNVISGIFCANPRNIPDHLSILPVTTRDMPSKTTQVRRELLWKLSNKSKFLLTGKTWLMSPFCCWQWVLRRENGFSGDFYQTSYKHKFYSTPWNLRTYW